MEIYNPGPNSFVEALAVDCFRDWMFVIRIQRSFLHYSANGELMSKLPKLRTKIKSHPILGTYVSEELQETSTLPLPRQCTFPLDVPTSLFQSLVKHHKREVPLPPLGSVVVVRRKQCISKPKVISFLGLVIEVGGKGLGEFVRVRNLIQSVGVELKFPLHSPLITAVDVIQQPKEKIVGPNLMGLETIGMEKYMPAAWMTEKGRMGVIRRIEQ